MNPPHADFTAPPPKPAPPANRAMLPCPFSAHGMQQPGNRQPPPMYGPRGATIPPQHLNPWTGGGGGGGVKSDNGRLPNGGGRGRGRGFQPRGGGGNQRPRHQHQQPRFGGQPTGQTPAAPLPPRFHAKPNADQQQQQTPPLLPPAIAHRQFWCEPCDRDFGDATELQRHRGQHQRCSVDGCRFEADAQLVARHVQQQHTSGLYDRLKNLTTPEEIARWREERRRRFPSQQNVELRQQMQEAKQKRGERLEAESGARFGQRADRRQPVPKLANRQPGEKPGGQVGAATSANEKDAANGKGRKRRNRKRGGNRDAAAAAEGSAASAAAAAAGKADDEAEWNDGVRMFRGTGAMKNYRRPRVRVANALSGLLGAYGSDEEQEEETEEEEEEEPDEETEGSEQVVVATERDIADVEMAADNYEQNIREECPVIEVEKPAEMELSHSETPPAIEESEQLSAQHPGDLDDSEAPAEESIQRASDQPEEPEPPQPATNCSQSPVGSNKRARPAASKSAEESGSAAKCPKRGAAPSQAHRTSSLDLSRRYRNQNTLLEKLLQRDIRHERNVLLQCVRYVVQNEFFGVGQPKKLDG